METIALNDVLSNCGSAEAWKKRTNMYKNGASMNVEKCLMAMEWRLNGENDFPSFYNTPVHHVRTFNLTIASRRNWKWQQENWIESNSFFSARLVTCTFPTHPWSKRFLERSTFRWLFFSLFLEKIKCQLP